jgi:hypothetical protein
MSVKLNKPFPVIPDTDLTKKRWQGSVVPWLMTGALVVLPLNTSAAEDEFVLKDFSDASYFSLNGDAKTVSTPDGVVLRLTSAARIQSGSVFGTEKASTANFSTYFTFRITEPGGVGSGGGDGFMFVLQPVSSLARGEGGGLGYEGMPKSVGVEFDIWNNQKEKKSYNDQDDNHVGINIQGKFDGPTARVEPSFENGQIWHAWIDYDGKQLEVRTNTTGKRPSEPLLTRKLNISDILGGIPRAYLGFSSATGGAYANHDILSLTYREQYAPVGKGPVGDGSVDVWMADSKRDKGVEPNKVSRRFWLSPDVWLRNKEDGISKYQNVEFGQDNYIYVRARNRGTATAKNTTIEVYRSIPAIGTRWPKGWQFVGKTQIDAIEPNGSKEVAIRWDKDDIPKPGHYCLYVRALNDADPMTSKERGDSLANMRKNNAIISRNFNVVDLLKNVTDEFEVTLHNTKDEDADVDIVFEEEDNLLDNDGAKVVVDLGPNLYSRWEEAGSKGVNIKKLGGTKVQLLKTPAKFTGIPMKPAESQTIKTKVEAFEPMPGEGTSREYHFSTQELVNGELAGGVDYSMVARAQDTDTDGDGLKDVTDEDDDNDGKTDKSEIKAGTNPLDPLDPPAAPSEKIVRIETVSETRPDTVTTNTLRYVLELAKNVPGQFEGTVSNLGDKTTNIDLVFEETNHLLDTGEVKVFVDLGPLFERWQTAGAKGLNVKRVAETTQVQLLKTPAKFTGIPLNGNESQTIQIKVDAKKTKPKEVTREYAFTTKSASPIPSTVESNVRYVLDLTKNVSGQFDAPLSNLEDNATTLNLVFEEKNDLIGQKQAKVLIDLGPLFERWQKAGTKGLNVKPVDEGTQVQLLKTPAKVMGIPLNASESQTLLISVEALEEPKPRERTTSEEYHFTTKATTTRPTESTTTTTRIRETTPAETTTSTIRYILDLADKVDGQFDAPVSNLEKKPANINLVFDEQNNLLDKDKLTVLVDLGPLFSRWQAAGAKGINVKPVDEGTQVQLLKTPAKIMGIPLNATESQTLLISVKALEEPKPIEKTTSEEYHFTTKATTTRPTESTVEETTRIHRGATPAETTSTIRYILDLADKVDGQFDAPVSNLGNKPANVNLVFDEQNNLLDKDKATVIVDLGSLFPRWQAAGAKGINVKTVDEGQVQLLKTPAKIIGIPLNAAESQTVLISVKALEESKPREKTTSEEYRFTTTTTRPTESTVEETTRIRRGATPAETTSTIRYILDLADKVDGQFDAPVSNLGNKPANVNLVFDEQNNLLDKDKATVIVDLGSLFPRWQAAGAKGINVKTVDEGQVQLLKTPAKIIGIPLNAAESQTVLISVKALEESKPREKTTSEEYRFTTTTTRPTESTVEETTRIRRGATPAETTSTIRYILDLANEVDGQFDAPVSNLGKKPANVNLVFDEQNNLLDKDKVTVIVDLGSLFPRWQAAGAKGINVKTFDEGTQVQLLNTPAKIMDIAVASGEVQIIQIKVNASEPKPEKVSTPSEYRFSTRGSTRPTPPVVMNGVGMAPVLPTPIAPSTVEERTRPTPPSTVDRTIRFETKPSTRPAPSPTDTTIRFETVPRTRPSKGSPEGTIHYQMRSWTGSLPRQGTIRFEVIPSTGTTVVGKGIDYPRYTDNRDGTVTDNKTGLVWLKNANCVGTQYPSVDRDYIPGDGKVTWQNAQVFVDGLNAGRFPECDAKHTDWRLPTVQELQSLVHYGFYNPAMSNTVGTKPWQPDDAFSNAKSDNYWTSTPDASNPDFAWRTRFDRGLVFTEHKSYPFYVWPVRGEQCKCSVSR